MVKGAPAVGSLGGPRSILISSASVGFAHLIADLLRAEPDIDKVVVPNDAEEFFAVIAAESFDLHLVSGATVDFHRSIRREVFEGGRPFQPSRDIALMLNEPDPFRALLAMSWGASRVIDMRHPLGVIVKRMLAPRGSPLWLADEIGRFRLADDPRSPTLEELCRDDIDLEIIEGIVEGLSDPEIAARINYAVQSVRNRVSRILMASHSRNRTHFAVRMLRSTAVRHTGT